MTNPSVATSFTAEIVPSAAAAGQTNTLNVTLVNSSSLSLPSLTLQQSAAANVTSNTNFTLGAQPLVVTGNASITDVSATSTGTSTIVTINAGSLTINGTLTLGSTTASTTLNNPYILLNNAASSLSVDGAVTLRSSEQTNGNIKFTNSGQTVTFNGSCVTANGNSTAEIFNFNGVNPTVNFNGNFTDGAVGTTFSVTGTEVPVINFNNGTSGTPMTSSSAGLRGAVTVNGYRQVTGANFRTSNATAAAYSMTVSGTLDLGANGSTATNSGGGSNTLAGSGTIKLTGDYATKISGYSANNFQANGALHLNGSAAQAIPAGTYGGLTLENAAGMTFGGDVSIAGTLTLTAGNITLGANNLTLSNAVAGTPGASKHIVTDGAGVVKKSIAASGSFTYPVGYDVSTYNPVTVALDNASTPDVISVKVASGVSPAAANNNAAVQATWSVTEAAAGGSNATLTFQWAAAQEGNLFTRSTGAIYWYNGSSWDNATGGAAAGSDPYTLSNSSFVTSLGSFTVGNDGGMPVELASFSGASNGSRVELHWSTATEQNNRGFDVERLTNGTWTKVSFVDGAGSSNAPKQYGYTDAVSANGKYSYRLKQIDNNGSFHYSSSVEVTVNAVPQEFSLAQNFPNPFNPSTSLQFTVKNAGPASLKVYDVAGREVANLFNEVAQPGQVYSVRFDGSRLASGVYFYVLNAKDFHSVKKMQLLK